MYRIRGMGAADSWYCPATGVSPAYWQIWLGCTDPNAPSVVAPPGLPAGTYGENPLPAPTSGGGTTLPTDPSQAGQVVSDLVNQQMVNQQNVNAGQVQSSWWDQTLGAPVAAANSVAAVPSWIWWAVAGLAGFVLVSAMGRGR